MLAEQDFANPAISPAPQRTFLYDCLKWINNMVNIKSTYHLVLRFLVHMPYCICLNPKRLDLSRMWAHFPKPPDAFCKWAVSQELWLRMQMSALSSFLALWVVSLASALSWMRGKLESVILHPIESTPQLCYFCFYSYTAFCS